MSWMRRGILAAAVGVGLLLAACAGEGDARVGADGGLDADPDAASSDDTATLPPWCWNPPNPCTPDGFIDQRACNDELELCCGISYGCRLCDWDHGEEDPEAFLAHWAAWNDPERCDAYLTEIGYW